MHPAPQAVLSLAVDASDTHIGGVLQQQRVFETRPGMVLQEKDIFNIFYYNIFWDKILLIHPVEGMVPSITDLRH